MCHLIIVIRNTVAEVIYSRADSSKLFMELTSFKGELPSIHNIEIVKII